MILLMIRMTKPHNYADDTDDDNDQKNDSYTAASAGPLVLGPRPFAPPALRPLSWEAMRTLQPSARKQSLLCFLLTKS